MHVGLYEYAFGLMCELHAVVPGKLLLLMLGSFSTSGTAGLVIIIR